jgi:CRISPR-associated endonuclease/helicase Cas3
METSMLLSRERALELLPRVLGRSSEAEVFPWQRRFLMALIDGLPPSSVDLPTGLGKTSVIALWLLARAVRGREIATRLVYVVDRRAVVDQSTRVAEGLRDVVAAEPDLQRALGLDGPLPISTLRGKHVDNEEWLLDPLRPAIVVGTVDMIGSRLLFSGYTVSPKMRAWHAALLGVDAWIVLDEAHLSTALRGLLRDVANDPDGSLRGGDIAALSLVPPLRFTSLSATGSEADDAPFALSADEVTSHPVVEQRLRAEKQVRLVDVDDAKQLAQRLAERAFDFCAATPACRVLVYADRREVAAAAHEEFARRIRSTDSQDVAPPILFVGARRVAEREGAALELAAAGFIAGAAAPATSTAVFATSAGEVGVDLDAHHMVCDLVPWERMVQRLGRVNRRGERAALVEIFVTPGETGEKAEAARRSQQHVDERRAAIMSLPSTGDGVFDGSPFAVLSTRDGGRALREKASTPTPLRPAATRPLIDAWSMTSLREHAGRPIVEPWLRGWVEEEHPQTTVIWRKHLPLLADGRPLSAALCERFFDAVRPEQAEKLETETFRVLELVARRVEARRKSSERARDEGAAAEPVPDTLGFVLLPDGTSEPVRAALFLPVDGKREKVLQTREREALQRALSGAILVLDARIGGLRDGLLDASADDVAREPDGLCFSTHVVADDAPDDARAPVVFAVDVDDDGTQRLVVRQQVNHALTEEARSLASHGKGPSKTQSLREHQHWAAEEARRLVQRAGLPDGIARAIVRATALHDEGKAAPRWQRAFQAPAGWESEPFAKVGKFINQTLLAGYRHELGSYLKVRRDLATHLVDVPKREHDLVLHLIVAHHGFARPLIPLSGCDEAPSELAHESEAIARRFVQLQREWGPWGLAWLETLLRAADVAASRKLDAMVLSNQTLEVA